jgi:subtilisin
VKPEEGAMAAEKRSSRSRQRAKGKTAKEATERRSVIVTFKPKDERPDGEKDKLELLSEVITSEVNFLDAGAVERGATIGVAPETTAYDVDEYEAPIVTVSLSDEEITAIEKNPNVAAVEDDGEMYALEAAAPPVQVPSARLAVEDQPSPLAETIPTGVNQIRAPLGWDCSRGRGIAVAVLDTGIDASHPDLAPNYRGGTSFVPGEPSPDDGAGHGTHCAGTIAAAINGSGVVGVAPAANLYAGKVLSSEGIGSWSWLISAIDWCIKRGIRVVSMSLGGSSAPGAVEAMCNAAWNKGLLLIAAAGNTGGNVGFPARYAKVVAVSAIDNANTIAPFSCRGPDVELCAPGVQVLSTLPGGGHGKMSGTSMACPHVSGAAVLAWGGHRFTTNTQIRRVLAKTSDNLGVPGRDDLYGYGRVDARQAACRLTPPGEVPGIP